MSSGFRDLFVSSADGLRLYVRDYGPGFAPTIPVICLPGLTRTSGDFHELATVLSTEATHPRRVLSIDYRGRGRSDWDRDWSHYDVRVETNDLLQVLIATGITEAIFIGTSRGGLIGMALGAIKPSLIRGVVLNDIGPVIEGKGVARIKGYVGKLPPPRNLGEAGQILKQISEAQFPKYTDAQWRHLAEGTWREEKGRLVLRYDPALMKMLDAIDLGMPLPDLWPLFEGLGKFPVLAIRGANSDMLSAQTLRLMAEAHPRLTALTAPDEGHAPAIEGKIAGAIIEFIRDVERPPRSRAA
ncbi:alpha/beta fold hydrolase [Microvirga brassicacearum]|uniref:Alpha/beta hydrolase n=1 Tax=Microvirga brassicacearum TaxID=2580413 RepID=A0A5N3P7Z4_9HYPH|nr:alpha/beta hydrolase [Microvirga brassicacearum]KAB0265847.1 alpha/beta hydrolase [Microvirga brassicacearum]